LNTYKVKPTLFKIVGISRIG